ncbi:hypothetical protein KIN20_022563 [Parelaphostrongylus tenuis]|uniref:Uncharacterized protein n=1 Tax=Parelaphostrongylus tenuis TaxID=148309 RepID=A0AAD5QV98_PARTN|nr:hypothetical protein KIN20_022563 [Parelaphostrongylus tenuis]
MAIVFEIDIILVERIIEIYSSYCDMNWHYIIYNGRTHHLLSLSDRIHPKMTFKLFAYLLSSSMNMENNMKDELEKRERSAWTSVKKPPDN